MQSSFLRTRRSSAIDVLPNEVGFFLRAFRNLRNPPFYPRAPCLFAFHRSPLSLSLSLTLLYLPLSLSLSFPSIVSYLTEWMKKFPPCSSMPFEILRPIAVGRNRKAALLSNDGAIPNDLPRRLARYILR